MKTKFRKFQCNYVIDLMVFSPSIKYSPITIGPSILRSYISRIVNWIKFTTSLKLFSFNNIKQNLPEIKQVANSHINSEQQKSTLIFAWKILFIRQSHLFHRECFPYSYFVGVLLFCCNSSAPKSFTWTAITLVVRPSFVSILCLLFRGRYSLYWNNTFDAYTTVYTLQYTMWCSDKQAHPLKRITFVCEKENLIHIAFIDFPECQTCVAQYRLAKHSTHFPFAYRATRSGCSATQRPQAHINRLVVLSMFEGAILEKHNSHT